MLGKRRDAVATPPEGPLSRSVQWCLRMFARGPASLSSKLPGGRPGQRPGEPGSGGQWEAVRGAGRGGHCRGSGLSKVTVKTTEASVSEIHIQKERKGVSGRGQHGARSSRGAGGTVAACLGPAGSLEEAGFRGLKGTYYFLIANNH